MTRWDWGQIFIWTLLSFACSVLLMKALFSLRDTTQCTDKNLLTVGTVLMYGCLLPIWIYTAVVTSEDGHRKTHAIVAGASSLAGAIFIAANKGGI